MWDLISPTRDGTRAPAVEVRSLNHWTAREVPRKVILILICKTLLNYGVLLL